MSVLLTHRVSALVRERIGDPSLSTSTLADALGVDRSTLYRALQTVGTTPSGLIRTTRMDSARQFLADGFGVGEVALRVGYEDPSAFARAFRRHHGCAPSRWHSCVDDL